jgi:hypothetical protein
VHTFCSKYSVDVKTFQTRTRCPTLPKIGCR